MGKRDCGGGFLEVETSPLYPCITRVAVSDIRLELLWRVKYGKSSGAHAQQLH